MPIRAYEKGANIGPVDSKLRYLHDTYMSEGRKRYALFMCECGNTTEVTVDSVKRGTSKSCGCNVRVNLAGKQFGMLEVIKDSGDRACNGQIIWTCICLCGNVADIPGTYLSTGGYKSCGCMKGNHKHGLAGTSEYYTWWAARDRCTNPLNASYADYGGRGIQMCKEWSISPVPFIMHIGHRPFGLTLDRINNDGNYEPGNVRWATYTEQNYNRRKRWND